MKLYTLVGTRIRLEPCISSLVTKMYVTKDLELKLLSQEKKDDGLWFYVNEGVNKGWVRFDFVKRIYDENL